MTSHSEESSSTDLESIHLRLDSLLVEYLELFTTYRTYHNEMSNSIRDGIFEMETIRHQHTINNAYLIDSTSYSGRDMFAAQRIKIEKSDTKNIKFSQQIEQIDENDENTDISTSSQSHIRKRILTAHESKKDRIIDKLIEKQFKKRENKLNENEEISSEDDLSDDNIVPDVDFSRRPLEWFGLLVKKHLPKVQMKFELSLPNIAQLATITKRLNVIEKEYTKLHQQLDEQQTSALSDKLNKSKISDDEQISKT